MFLRISLRPIVMSGVKRDSAMANLSWPSSNNRASPPSTSEADTHMEPTTGYLNSYSTPGAEIVTPPYMAEVHQHYPIRLTSTIQVNNSNNGFSRLREPEDFFFRLTGNKTMAPRLSDLVYRFDMEAPLSLISLRINVRLLLPYPHRWFPNWHPS